MVTIFSLEIFVQIFLSLFRTDSTITVVIVTVCNFLRSLVKSKYLSSFSISFGLLEQRNSFYLDWLLHLNLKSQEILCVYFCMTESNRYSVKLACLVGIINIISITSIITVLVGHICCLFTTDSSWISQEAE